MKLLLSFVSIILLTDFAYGQELVKDTIQSKIYNAEVGLAAIATSGSEVPFWMRANQFGSIPLNGVSMSVVGKIEKKYREKKIVDWGAAIDFRLNAGTRLELIPVEMYVKGKLGIFQVRIGRSKDISGIIDTTLSTGSYAISGNALGVPKIELSMPDFQSIPFVGKIIAFKGSFSHGWMGKVPIQFGELKGSSVESYLHNASFHIRFGKPKWKFKLYGGINHEVIWGNDKLIFGDQYDLSRSAAFWHVVTGKRYLTDGLKQDISKVGNHLGAIDLAIELDVQKANILIYRQHFYDKGALAYLANVEDGLTGISIKNKDKSKVNWTWTKFLFEIFYSKGQAGERDAKETPSGAEYYYNHAVYSEGYSYKGIGLGNPLITTVRKARTNLPNAESNYFINNRVIAFHIGTEGRMARWLYQLKLTYSQNYGEYRTSNIPFWYLGTRHERNRTHDIFQKVSQFSGHLEIDRPLRSGVFVGLTLASDYGKLLYNSTGISVRLVKRW
jgi:hypothetical protein